LLMSLGQAPRLIIDRALHARQVVLEHSDLIQVLVTQDGDSSLYRRVPRPVAVAGEIRTQEVEELAVQHVRSWHAPSQRHCEERDREPIRKARFELQTAHMLVHI